ncbi:hypothetical protein, partial [Rothia nasimurium]|uniref:hypothetical protein n=1 Tax=Rothia nasimurium TaxID=85336 RepID=UPI001ADD6C66
SASRRRALVLSSWGYLVGMGEVPLLFFVCFQCTGSELNPVHIIPEKFVFPYERQFQVDTRIPSTTNDPGAFRLSFKGLLSG